MPVHSQIGACAIEDALETATRLAHPGIDCHVAEDFRERLRLDLVAAAAVPVPVSIDNTCLLVGELQEIFPRAGDSQQPLSPEMPHTDRDPLIGQPSRVERVIDDSPLQVEEVRQKQLELSRWELILAIRQSVGGCRSIAEGGCRSIAED